ASARMARQYAREEADRHGCGADERDPKTECGPLKAIKIGQEMRGSDGSSYARIRQDDHHLILRCTSGSISIIHGLPQGGFEIFPRGQTANTKPRSRTAPMVHRTTMRSGTWFVCASSSRLMPLLRPSCRWKIGAVRNRVSERARDARAACRLRLRVACRLWRHPRWRHVQWREPATVCRASGPHYESNKRLNRNTACGKAATADRPVHRARR